MAATSVLGTEEQKGEYVLCGLLLFSYIFAYKSVCNIAMFVNCGLKCPFRHAFDTYDDDTYINFLNEVKIL